MPSGTGGVLGGKIGLWIPGVDKFVHVRRRSLNTCCQVGANRNVPFKFNRFPIVEMLPFTRHQSVGHNWSVFDSCLRGHSSEVHEDRDLQCTLVNWFSSN